MEWTLLVISELGERGPIGRRKEAGVGIFEHTHNHPLYRGKIEYNQISRIVMGQYWPLFPPTDRGAVCVMCQREERRGCARNHQLTEGLLPLFLNLPSACPLATYPYNPLPSGTNVSSS